MLKVNDIVKVINIERVKKIFLKERVGIIERIIKLSQTKKMYVVYFIFDFNIEEKYISEWRGVFFESELKKANKKEREQFYRVYDRLKAYELAKRL